MPTHFPRLAQELIDIVTILSGGVKLALGTQTYWKQCKKHRIPMDKTTRLNTEIDRK